MGGIISLLACRVTSKPGYQYIALFLEGLVYVIMMVKLDYQLDWVKKHLGNLQSALLGMSVCVNFQRQLNHKLLAYYVNSSIHETIIDDISENDGNRR